MTWPDTSPDTTIADALRNGIEATPAWLDLDPQPGAVFAYTWPAEPELPIGPRLLVHPPSIVSEAIASDAIRHQGTTVVEIHLPVDAREALAAAANLRDALARVDLPGVRIISVALTAFISDGPNAFLADLTITHSLLS
jgi:hypothetical protein